MNKHLGIFLIFGIITLSIIQVNSVPVYLGVKIENLTDDPAHSCAGEGLGYENRGRIRAFSAILPTYPIFFNLTNSSGGTVWSGDGTDNVDYTIGDIMLLPNSVDLDVGQTYNLFFDIDAIRIYLPLVDYLSFTANIDDEYWTVGRPGTSGSGNEAHAYSVDCTYSSSQANIPTAMYYVSNNRNTNFAHSCQSDTTAYNCDDVGLHGLRTSNNANDFRIDGLYNNIYLPNVGNFNIGFTLS